MLKSVSQAAARGLLALTFIVTGLSKVFAFSQTAGWMAAAGFPLPQFFLAGAIVFELGGGLMLLFGWNARWAALGLFAFLIPTTLIFHVANLGDPAQAQMQTIQVLKNIAILGGLLKFYADGAGSYSLDNKTEKRVEPSTLHLAA